MTGKQGGTTTRKPKPPPPPPKRQRGRPSKRSKRLEEEILDWIRQGETLRDFCRQPGRPSKSAIYGWLNSDVGFSGRFALARDHGQEEMSERAFAQMWTDHTGPDGRVDPGRVQLTRMRVWGTVQLLAKWNPKRWGNRLELAGDQENPLLLGLSDEDAARQVALLLSRAAARRAEQENGDPAPRDPEDKSKPIREARKKTPAPTTEAAPASEPETVFTIPRQWILEAQRRWRAPAARPLVSAAGVALTADGSCTIVRRADRFIDQPTRKLQDAQAIFDAAGGAVPIAMIGAGAQLFAERCGKVGLTVNVLHATIDRPKLEMTLRDALDPDASVQLGLPPGSLREDELLAIAAALNVSGPERHFQPVVPMTRRVQRPPHDPFREV